MTVKVIRKILSPATQIAIGITILLFSNSNLIVKAQNIATFPVSSESTSAATDLFNRGKAEAEQENYRDAIANFSKAIQLNPNRADFYYERGLILGKLGDKEGAIRDFDSAILRNPNYAQAYLQRAGMSFYVGSERRITDSRGIDFRSVDYRARNSQAILDLRTARDLFAQQGDREGYKTANSLIQHFTGSTE